MMSALDFVAYVAIFPCLVLPIAAPKGPVGQQLDSFVAGAATWEQLLAVLAELPRDEVLRGLVEEAESLRASGDEWHRLNAVYRVAMTLQAGQCEPGVTLLLTGIDDSRVKGMCATALQHDRVAPEFHDRVVHALLHEVKDEADQQSLHPSVANALSTFGQQGADALPDLDRVARSQACDANARVEAFSCIIRIGGFESAIFGDPDIDAAGRRYRFAAFTASWTMFREQHPNVDIAELDTWATRAVSLAEELINRDQAELKRSFLESLGQIYWALGLFPAKDKRGAELKSRVVKVLGTLCESEVDTELRDAACRGRDEMKTVQSASPKDGE